MNPWKGPFPSLCTTKTTNEDMCVPSFLHLSSLINIFKFSQFQLKTFLSGEGKGKICGCMFKEEAEFIKVTGESVGRDLSYLFF